MRCLNQQPENTLPESSAHVGMGGKQGKLVTKINTHRWRCRLFTCLNSLENINLN